MLEHENQSLSLSESQIRVLEESAGKCDAVACMRLYEYYEYVALDFRTAETLLAKAAEAGNSIAQYTLGVLLSKRPEPEAKQRGIAWLKLAAASGSTQAATALQKMGGN